MINEIINCIINIYFFFCYFTLNPDNIDMTGDSFKIPIISTISIRFDLLLNDVLRD